MKFQIIESKSLDINSDTDLLSVIQNYQQAEIEILEIVVIDEATVMRLDLFMNAYYGTLDDFDLVLKINGIVNPFETPIGSILILPDLTSLKSSIQNLNINQITNKLSVTSADGKSIASNRTTRTIGFQKLTNGNLVF